MATQSHLPHSFTLRTDDDSLSHSDDDHCKSSLLHFPSYCSACKQRMRLDIASPSPRVPIFSTFDIGAAHETAIGIHGDDASGAVDRKFDAKGIRSPIARQTKNDWSIRTIAVAFFFGGAIAVLRALFSVVPPDFLDRWCRFFEEGPVKDLLKQSDAKRGTVLYDCHGTVIATLGRSGYRQSKHGTSLRPLDIPSYMWQAVIASEDRRFFEHKGVDPRGLSRAALSLASSGGGSTITQQLVKNVFLTNERKWARKLVEIILALLVEMRMSKWDILHTYLKKIYWGHGMYGIEAASSFYFGKYPSLLTLGECAMLTGIIPAPELLSPYRDPSRGKKPQARVLRRMVEAGFLDPCTAAAVLNEPLEVGTEGHVGTSGPWKAPFFVSEVLYELNQKYGWDKVLEGGLQVYTTLDLTMQEIAEKVIRDGVTEYDTERSNFAEQCTQKTCTKLENLSKTRQAEIDRATSKFNIWEGFESRVASSAVDRAISSIMKKFVTSEKTLESALYNYQHELRIAAESRLEAAMVTIDPLDGAVRVLVGGRDYTESSFNRSTQAYRPPGSTFMPVVYLTALAEGIGRNHVLVDEPYTVGGFSPENYDHKFRGKVTLEEALLTSLNVPTVKLCAEVGVDKVCHMGNVLGIQTSLPYELALSLGGCEVTPLQLATVYSTIAAGGVYHKPYFINRIDTSDGHVLEEAKVINGQQNRVVNEIAVLELRKLLQGVVERGTGRAARMGRPCAGKTGTSDGHRDVWFAGFTPELSCVVWLGYDDNTPIGGIFPGTGASHAAPIWQRFMSMVHKGLPIKEFHDMCHDKSVTKAPRHTARRTRHFSKRGTQAKRKSSYGITINTAWKDVCDWENASSVWEERERMEEWTTTHMKRAAQIEEIRAQWQQMLQKWGRCILCG